MPKITPFCFNLSRIDSCPLDTWPGRWFPDTRSSTIIFPVSNASFIVVANTPTGPRLIQPLQYRPAQQQTLRCKTTQNIEPIQPQVQASKEEQRTQHFRVWRTEQLNKIVTRMAFNTPAVVRNHCCIFIKRSVRIKRTTFVPNTSKHLQINISQMIAFAIIMTAVCY